ncbi:hypothetical protein BH23ACT11_BH23ACT11_11020 [soil metagenome]
MEAYRTDVTVDKDGNVVINKPPFRKGEKLEAILLRQAEEVTQTKTYSIRGEPVRYVNPFDGVDEDHWRALS